MSETNNNTARKSRFAIEQYSVSASFPLDSKRKGPKVLFFGAIHGNERCGTVALRKLMEKLSTGKLRIRIRKGSITCIPVCNPKAFAKDVRCCEDNLNRIFRRHVRPATDEARIANVLTAAVDECDVLIDLHSCLAPSPPFVFLDYQTGASRRLVKSVGLTNVVRGWPEIYAKIRKMKGDKTPPDYDTASYAHEQGKISVTIECGRHQTVSAERIAYRSVVNVLRGLGVIKGKPRLAKKERGRVVRLMKFFFKEADGDVLSRRWKNLQPFSRGQEVARRADGTVISFPYDGFVVLPKQNAKASEEWFYIARAE